jgi:hypothetical protein
MALAMTAALEDASDFTPWSMLVLRPPDAAFWTPVMASLASVFAFIGDNWWAVGTLVALASVLLFQYRLTLMRRYRIESEFIAYFVDVLRVYMLVAIENPEGFQQYLDRRRDGGSATPGSPLPA